MANSDLVTDSQSHGANGWFWTLYSHLYDTIWDSPVSTLLAERIAEQVGRASWIVSIGCGTGLCVQCLDPLAVVGVDTSRSMLRRARSNGRIGLGVVADAEGTSLPSGCADAVIVANVLHLHPDPVRVLAEGLRLLRPGGRLVLSWPSRTADANTVAATQRALGWGTPRTVLALTLTTLVGLLGLGCGVTRRRSEDLEDLIHRGAQSLGLDTVTEGSVVGLQRILVLEREG
jgi:SAM-dependent methyltransferase